MDIEQTFDTILRLDKIFLNDIYQFLDDYFIDNDSIILKEPITFQESTGELTITSLEQDHRFIYAIINGKRINLTRLTYETLFKIYQTIKK